ncbi:MAG: aminotransferase class V-fold PLP-dependent enzyme [Burkholderiales bacterium]
MSASRIEAAVAAMGDGPLNEAGVARHVAPLFSRVLAQGRERVYLANHSLGRPLDATEDDVREGVAAWYARMGGAWDAWSEEMRAFRTRLAQLLGAPRHDCVVPKTSAGQGLRAILNTYDTVPHVVATRGEFDSLDVILREYARRGRIALTLVEPEALAAAVEGRVDLVVVSQVVFNTGRVVSRLADAIARTHRAGGRVLLDVYHSLGVMPVDVQALGVDFAVGGSYKYLRGGPGACFLYLAPRHLDGHLRTLDIGWFAKREPFAYRRPDPPVLAEGGDAFLESTPPVLTSYQARAGQVFTIAVGVERLRAYSLDLQRRLVDALASHGVQSEGATADRGAFLVVEDEHAEAWADALEARGVATDARGRYLRLCPDVLTTEAEIAAAATAVAATRPPRG